MKQITIAPENVVLALRDAEIAALRRRVAELEAEVTSLKMLPKEE